MTEVKDVQSCFMQYFSSTFASSNPSKISISTALSGSVEQILVLLKEQLDSPYTSEEVIRALFSMSPWKAPGPDGFHADLY